MSEANAISELMEVACAIRVGIHEGATSISKVEYKDDQARFLLDGRWFVITIKEEPTNKEL